MKKFIYLVLVIVFAAASIYSLYQVYDILNQNYVEESQNDYLNDVAKGESTEKQNDVETTKVIDFKALQEINSDIIGWIHIPDTTIDYAIVQGNDNDYYLHYNAMKEENYAGAVFMDYRNHPDFSDDHTIIYAHNVKHGTMFAPLELYQDEQFFKEHPVYDIYTPNQYYQVHVFAFYTTTDTSDAYEISFNQNKMDDIQKWQLQSLYQNDVQISENDCIVTLSTCSYQRNNQPSELRYVLKGVLKKAS